MKRKLKPAHSVEVGDIVGLLPDDRVPKRDAITAMEPNSTLDIGEGPYEVEKVVVSENKPLISVKGSFKRLYLFRFYQISRIPY